MGDLKVISLRPQEQVITTFRRILWESRGNLQSVRYCEDISPLNELTASSARLIFGPIELQESREEEYYPPEQEHIEQPNKIEKVVIQPPQREEDKVLTEKIEENDDDEVIVATQDEPLEIIETPQKDEPKDPEQNEEETNENVKTVPRNADDTHTNAVDDIPITAKACSFEELLARNLQNEDANEEGIFGKSVPKPTSIPKPKQKPKQRATRDDSVKTQKRSDAMKHTPLKEDSKEIEEMSSTIKISK